MSKSIRQLQKEIHETAKDKGWWDGDGVGSTQDIATKLLLIHSEISEATECLREDDMLVRFKGDKPEGFQIELADTIIRILDLCGYMGIDMQNVIELKTRYNTTRPYRHGNKKI